MWRKRVTDRIEPNRNRDHVVCAIQDIFLHLLMIPENVFKRNTKCDASDQRHRQTNALDR